MLYLLQIEREPDQLTSYTQINVLSPSENDRHGSYRHTWCQLFPEDVNVPSFFLRRIRTYIRSCIHFEGVSHLLVQNIQRKFVSVFGAFGDIYELCT